MFTLLLPSVMVFLIYFCQLYVMDPGPSDLIHFHVHFMDILETFDCGS